MSPAVDTGHQQYKTGSKNNRLILLSSENQKGKKTKS